MQWQAVEPEMGRDGSRTIYARAVIQAQRSSTILSFPVVLSLPTEMMAHWTYFYRFTMAYRLEDGKMFRP